MKNFLISYTNTDLPWAEWLAWVLEENGSTVATQAWDAQVGSNFVEEMEQAMVKGQQVLIVLSEIYLRSITSQKEGRSTFWLLREFQNQHIIPIRIEDFNPPGELIQVGYINLVDTSEFEAEQAILAVLQEKPESDRSSVAGAPTTPEETIQVDENDDGQLKLERRYHTVQFFVEQLANDIGIEMMQIPAGRFLMGSPEDELDRRSNEEPQHEVAVAHFFMGKYPVTQAQWKVVANLPQVSRELAPDPSRFKGDKRPVERVSWYDAVEFCERLSAYTGREYRLPSEAEWEYACRASPMPKSATPASGEVRSANPIFRAGISKAGEAVGNNTPQPFHFGKTITTDVANYRGTDDEEYGWSGSYGEGPKGEYRQETTPVDHFKIANAFGLCDMHGNVWEWCADHWHDSYEGAPTDGSAWLGENENENRVLRGGSWYYNPRNCRSAYRYYDSPAYRNDSIGFRVICSAP